jgi:hypothetical protein
MQEVVDAEAMSRGNKTIYGDICLERTRSADPDDIQLFQAAADLSCFKIDVGQGVQFIDHDVDIVWPDA